MSKVDSALYWHVHHKNNKLISENEELKRKLKSVNSINPRDHISINGIEHHLDLSNGLFYTKENFQEFYGSKSSELWDKSGLILQSIINELNKHL